MNLPIQLKVFAILLLQACKCSIISLFANYLKLICCLFATNTCCYFERNGINELESLMHGQESAFFREIAV